MSSIVSNCLNSTKRDQKAAITLFQNKRILITGGMGFIGSNLAIRLVQAGACVTILDDMNPEYGGNHFNIEPIKDRLTVYYGDIRDPDIVNVLVGEKDFIFHLAGQVCHLKSLENPFPDIDINIKGTAILMEACKKFNPKVVVVYTGTRGQYGPATKFPVNEKALPQPKGIYEISNLSAEQIVKVYHDIHGVRSVMLRLTNIYGPRAQMKHNRFGVANWFIRLALDGNVIPIFGDGSILRDFLYVDDCVEALLFSAAQTACYGEMFNVGNSMPASFLELAKTIIKVLGTGRYEFRPFSPERKAQEPGNFYSDITKIRKATGWQPQLDLEEGVRRTAKYYQANREKYWATSG